VGLARATVHEVLVQSMTFSPADLQIEVGDTVHWVWEIGIHTVTSGASCTSDGLFDAPLSGTDPEFSFTFDDPGFIDYFCTPHCGFGMVGTIEVSGISDVSETVGATSLEGSVSPNPFIAGTDIRFSLNGSVSARIEIFDATGRHTAFLGEVASTQGSHSTRWNGSRDDGTQAPSGIYYARISAGSDSQVLRLVKID